MNNFSELIRQRRQTARLTQAELAKRVGVKQQTVARWEQGSSTPTRDTLASIARAFSEPDDKWIRAAGRNADSDLPRLLHPVRSRIGYLPLGELTPSEFERFTDYLISAYYRDARVTRGGGPGHAQQGADILVHTPDGTKLFQCKRKLQFGPARMKAVAEAAATAIADKRVLVLSRVASQSVRSAAERLGWDIWDHDDIVRILQQKLCPESARRVLDVFFPGWTENFLGIRGGTPWARPDEFFVGQTEKAFFSHSYDLVGRGDEITKVLEWARGDRPFFLLTGAAGVGKSRFLMEAARRIDADAGHPVVYFVERSAPIDLEDFRRLGEDRPVIVVDDAHDRDDLELIIRGSRSRSEPRRQPRVLFATRDYGEPRLRRELAEHAHELDPDTAHLAPLKRADARRLASHVLEDAENSPLTMRLVAVTRDCTLFLVAAGYLLKTDHVDPAFLDDEEGFRVAVLEKMYQDYVRGAGQLADAISVADVLSFLAAVQPFDLNADDAIEAASRVLGCCRDLLTPVLGQIARAGVVVKRGSRLRIQPDLLADHILVKACFDRTLEQVTGYAGRIWKAGSATLRRNLIVNVARIDWRLSKSGMSPDSMLTEAWCVLEREFKESGILQREELLDLLEKVAFYQPKRTLNLVKWAMNDELPPEQTKFGTFTYEGVRSKLAPVLRACAYHREWLNRSCELLWRLAQSDCRPTNPHPEHPVRILCDLAAYSRYKPFDHTREVTMLAIEWLRRDRVKLVFEILDKALRKEFDDHISDGHSVTYYPYSALVLGKGRVLELQDEVLDAVIQQLHGNGLSLAVRAAESLKLALFPPVGHFGRKINAEEIAVWQEESVRLLRRIRDGLNEAQLSPPVAVALREAVEPARHQKIESIATAAEEVLTAVADDLVHQVVEVLIHGPWRWHRYGPNRDPSPDDVQQRLKDLAQRYLEDSGEPSTAVQRLEQHLVDISVSSDAWGAGQFVAALVDQQLGVGIETVRRVIANADSPLVQVTGAALSAIRSADVEQAFELAQSLISTGRPSARVSVAYAYRWGLSSAPTVSSGELTLIRELAADNDIGVAHQLSSGLRFMAERDPRIALTVILEMRIGRSEKLAGKGLGLFQDAGPLRIEELGKDELDRIVEELVECNGIDDYWVQGFLVSLSRIDLQRVVRLLQRRVEHAETHDEHERSPDESTDYRPIPFDWHDKWRLESLGTQDRRRILEELRDWATAEDALGWRRRYEAPLLFAAVASEFDDEVLDVIERGLKAPPTIARHVANLLSEAPLDFAWSHAQWIVRTLEGAARRDAALSLEDYTLYEAIGDALHSKLFSGVRTGSPGEPFPEDVRQLNESRRVADGLPVGSPGERFYRSVQRNAEHSIERKRNMDLERHD